MSSGQFIVLEGIDGAGTTTQAALLADWLRSRGHRAVPTLEPTEGPFGSIIRRILEGSFGDAVNEQTMAFLFGADRSDHLHRTIVPALEAGSVVVSDRYYLSSVAYQSLDVEMAWVEALNARFPRPGLTVFLDVPPEVSLERKRAMGTPAERYEHLHFLERIRANYLEAIAHAQAAGERIETLDGSEPTETVAERIRALVAPLLA